LIYTPFVALSVATDLALTGLSSGKKNVGHIFLFKRIWQISYNANKRQANHNQQPEPSLTFAEGLCEDAGDGARQHNHPDDCDKRQYCRVKLDCTEAKSL
jgi:hypothetical protein